MRWLSIFFILLYLYRYVKFYIVTQWSMKIFETYDNYLYMNFITFSVLNLILSVSNKWKLCVEKLLFYYYYLNILNLDTMIFIIFSVGIQWYNVIAPHPPLYCHSWWSFHLWLFMSLLHALAPFALLGSLGRHSKIGIIDYYFLVY